MRHHDGQALNRFCDRYQQQGENRYFASGPEISAHSFVDIGTVVCVCVCVCVDTGTGEYLGHVKW